MAGRVYRVRVANKTTGAEAVIKIEAATPAIAESIAAERGFLVAGTVPEADPGTTESGSAPTTKDIDDICAGLHSVNGRLDRLLDRTPDSRTIRDAVASAVTVALWRMMLALFAFALLLAVAVALASSGGLSPIGGLIAGLIACFGITVIFACRKP